MRKNESGRKRCEKLCCFSSVVCICSCQGPLNTLQYAPLLILLSSPEDVMHEIRHAMRCSAGA